MGLKGALLHYLALVETKLTTWSERNPRRNPYNWKEKGVDFTFERKNKTIRNRSNK